MSNFKKTFSIVVTVLTIVWSVGLVAAPTGVSAATAAGDLIKMAGNSAVYYFDGTKRYVFPNQTTYMSWYNDFSSVKTVPASELSSYPIGGNVTMRPGTWLVKITTDPVVYAVEPGGTLRSIGSEARALKLYGSTWNKKIVDVPDAFFVNYKSGSALTSDVHPTGTIVKYASGSTWYYIDNGVKRPFASDAALTANGINSTKFGLTTDISYGDGSSLTGKETAIANIVGSAGTVVVGGTGLTVGLASDTPSSTSLISDTSNGGQAVAPVMKLNFTAGNDGAVKVTTLKFKKGGISTDSDVNNAYLYDGETRLAEMQSISSGVLTFSDSAGLFTVPASSSKGVVVKMDLVGNTSAGKTFVFSLNSATDVVASGATISGTFPMTGNTFTTASVTDLGRLKVAHVTDPGTTTDAQDNLELWRSSFNATNQNLKVTKVRYTNVGSSGAADIKNLKLFDGGTQIGGTVAAMEADRTVTFDLSASPLSIISGITKNLSLRGDIVSGASRTIRFSFQRSADITVMDANYNVYIAPTLTSSTTWSVIQATNTTTINSGSMSVSKASASPTGNIATNGTNILFGTWEFKASGENIKVSTLTLDATVTGSRTLKNVKILLDGVQVGSSQTTVVGDGTDYAVNMGNSFVAQAGVTHIVKVYGDLTGTATSTDTVSLRFVTGSSNAQGINSLTASNVPSAMKAANTLTITAGALTGAKNVSVGAVTAVTGVTAKIIASFTLTAGAAEGVDLNSVAIQDSDGAGANGANGLGAAFTNLKLMNGTTQIGQTVVNPSSTAGTVQTFNLNPAVSITAGQSVRLDVVADVISGATWTATNVVRITTATSGTGKNTNTTISLAALAEGQSITVASAGTLTVSLEGSMTSNQQLVMGSTDNNIGAWKFEANNNEDLTVNQIIVDSTTSVGGDVLNLKLFVDAAQVGNTVPSLSAASNGSATFGSSSSTLFTIPAGSFKIVTLRASIPTQLDATGNGAITPKIVPTATITGVAADKIIARGSQSGTYALVATASQGTTYAAISSFAYRTKLTAANVAVSGSSTGRVRTSNDTIFKMSLVANSGYQGQFRAGAINAMDATTDDFSGGVTTAGTWAVVTVGDDGSTMAADTSVKVAGTGSMLFTQGATTPVAANGLAYTFTAADLSGFNGMAFWVKASNATPNLTLTLTGAGAGSQTVNPSSTDWEFMVVPFSGATTPFTGLTAITAISMVSATAYTAADTVNVDSFYFYKDFIKANLAISASGTDETLVTLKDNDSGTTFAAGYTDGTATAQTAYFIPTTDFNVTAGGSRTLSVVTDTSALLAASTNVSVNVSLGSSSSTVAAPGDVLWYDGKVSTSVPWLDTNPNPVQGGSLGY